MTIDPDTGRGGLAGAANALFTALDRAAHRRADLEWLEQAWKTARIIVVAPDSRALVTGLPEKPGAPTQMGPTGPGTYAAAEASIPAAFRQEKATSPAAALPGTAERASAIPAPSGAAESGPTPAQPDLAFPSSQPNAEAGMSPAAAGGDPGALSTSVAMTAAATAVADAPSTIPAPGNQAQECCLVFVGPEGVEGERFFLGVDTEGVAYFAVAGEPGEVAGARLVHLWEVGAELNPRDAKLFAQAIGLVHWHRDYRFSPMTGTPTTLSNAGWVRREDDGTEHFPRTDPAVIMLVHDGVSGPQGRALLGSGALWPPRQGVRRYSTLAGFVEPGETAEAAVAREVLEEAGVHVRQVSYVGSQPHPYPRSLMLGYTCLADPAEPVVIDPGELADARWFTREEVLAVLNGQSNDFGLPYRSSIAYRLVTRWAYAN